MAAGVDVARGRPGAQSVMHGFEPSLLDKLCSDAPSMPLRRLSTTQLMDAVVRDLEALLNTRRVPVDDFETRYPAAAASLTGYGLEDFASLSLCSVHDRVRICRAIERAIERHEPRLGAVAVTLERSAAGANALRFIIRAVLAASPAREPVSFDAVLHPTRLQYSVSPQRARAATG